MCNRQIGGICHSVYLGDLQTHLYSISITKGQGRSKVLYALKQNMPSLLANQIPTVVCTPLATSPGFPSHPAAKASLYGLLKF